MKNVADNMAEALEAVYGAKSIGDGYMRWVAENGPEWDDIVAHVEGATGLPFVDGWALYWESFGPLRDAVAFWRASSHTGGQYLLDGSGNGHHLRLGSTESADTNDPLFLPYSGEKYLYHPDVSGNYVSSPVEALPAINHTWRLTARIAPEATADYRCIGGDLSGQGGHGGMVYLRGGNGAQVFFSDGAATATSGLISTSGLVPGVLRYYRWTVDIDADTATCESSDDGEAWEVEWTVALLSTVTPVPASSRRVAVGAVPYVLTTYPNTGRIYSLNLEFDGITVASWSAEDMGQGGGTSGGRTWTISRATSGRKAVLVDRPLFLFSTDDYMEAPDHDDLDFDVDDEWTVVVVERDFGSQSGPILSKRASAGASPAAPGWLLRHQTSRIPLGVIDDAAIAATASVGATAAGVANVIAMRRKGSEFAVIQNGVAGTPQTALPPATLENAVPLFVGHASGSTAFADMEFMGAAIFRRALSDDEIALVGKALGAD